MPTSYVANVMIPTLDYQKHSGLALPFTIFLRKQQVSVASNTHLMNIRKYCLEIILYQRVQ